MKDFNPPNRGLESSAVKDWNFKLMLGIYGDYRVFLR